MKPYGVNTTTGETEKLNLQPGEKLDDGAGKKIMWLPRIKCNDCPGKLCKFHSPEGMVVV